MREKDCEKEEEKSAVSSLTCGFDSSFLHDDDECQQKQLLT